MNLTELLALSRGAANAEVRKSLYGTWGAQKRSDAYRIAFERAKAIRDNANSTQEERAEMAHLLDVCDELRAIVAEDTAVAQRFQVNEQFDNAPAGRTNFFGPAATPSQQRSSDPGPSNPTENRDPNTPEIRWNQGDSEDMPVIYGRTPDGRMIARFTNPYALGLTPELQRAISEPSYRDAFLRLQGGIGDEADRRTVEGPSAQFRALNGNQEGDGGVLIPAVIQARVLERLADPSTLLGNYTQVNAGGPEVIYPKFLGGDDVASSGLALQWPGDTGTTTEDTSLEAWGTKNIPIHRYAIEVRAARNWLEDTNDPISWLASKISDCHRLGLLEVTTTGNGIGKPRGYMDGAGNTGRPEVVNINDPIDHIGLLAIMGELPEQYEEDAIFVSKRITAFQRLYAIEDTAGNLIGGLAQVNDGGLATKRVPQIFGVRNVFNPYMPALGAGNQPLSFGDMKGYIFALRKAMTMEILTDATLQRKDIRAWYVRGRVGGDVGEEWRIKVGQQTDR